MLIVFEVLLPSPVQANDWFYLATGETEDRVFQVFADETSIARTGNIASMRSMLVNQQIDRYGIAAVIYLDEFACDKNQYRILQRTYLYDDQSVRQERGSSSDEWRPVESQSIAELKLQAACRSTQSR
jgi:hypothetical protein